MQRDIDQATVEIERQVAKSYTPYGAAAELFRATDKEVLISGPAGTGKTRANLEKLDDLLAQYAGARALIIRKTFAALKGSGLVTFDEKVRPQDRGVIFKGETAKRPPHYLYPNGSVAVVGGMDKAVKVMSAEYDLIIVIEAIEFTADEWEALTTRLRNGVLPFQQLLGDCNPDAETHWLKQRCNAGTTRLLESRHEDNPTLFDQRTGEITTAGREYLATLDALTGVRYLRLRKGKWAAAEGAVYEDSYDAAVNLVDRFDVPREWPRFWSVDFGFTNPFCWQAWAQDPDGRLIRYLEIYRTQRLVEDHARDILDAIGYERDKETGALRKAREDADTLPQAIICDHDAEDRATLERHLGLPTTAAYKAISAGIQAVASRWKVAGDDKPRLMLMRDSLVERDERLVEKKLPTCTEEEIDGYVWNTKANRKKGEEPLDKNNHGCDAKRYLVAHIDITGATPAASAGRDPEGDAKARFFSERPRFNQPRWRQR